VNERPAEQVLMPVFFSTLQKDFCHIVTM